MRKQDFRRSRRGVTLIEVIGVATVLTILVIMVSVGVVAAVNRARIISAKANFKLYEIALASYLAMPHNADSLPRTDGAESDIPFLQSDGSIGNAPVKGSYFSIDQVLMSAGLLEKRLNWRIGDNPSLVGQDFKWSMRYQAFVYANGDPENTNVLLARGSTTSPLNNVAAQIRAEAFTSGINGSNINPDRIAPANYNPELQQSITFRLYDGSRYLPADVTVAFLVIPEISINDALDLSDDINGKLHTATRNNPLQLDGPFVFRPPTGSGSTTTAFYYLHSF